MLRTEREKLGKSLNSPNMTKKTRFSGFLDRRQGHGPGDSQARVGVRAELVVVRSRSYRKTCPKPG